MGSVVLTTFTTKYYQVSVFRLNLNIDQYESRNRYNCSKNLRHFQNTLMCVVIYIVIHTIHCCLKFRDQLMLVSAVID